MPEFSVHRSQEWLEDIKNLENVKDFYFAEYIRCFSFITGGKSKYIDGTGIYEDFIGSECIFSTKYLEDNLFFKTKCKVEPEVIEKIVGK